MKWITAQTFHIMDGLTQKSLSSMPGPIMGTTGLRTRSYCPVLLWAPQDFVLPGPIMGTTRLRIQKANESS